MKKHPENPEGPEEETGNQQDQVAQARGRQRMRQEHEGQERKNKDC